jgi:hypothetical protein
MRFIVMHKDCLRLREQALAAGCRWVFDSFRHQLCCDVGRESAERAPSPLALAAHDGVASHPDLQADLRCAVGDTALDRAIDEMLRLDDPFVLNRRVTTREVELGVTGCPRARTWCSTGQQRTEARARSAIQMLFGWKFTD